MSTVRCDNCGDMVVAVYGQWTSCDCGDIAVSRFHKRNFLAYKPRARFTVLDGRFIPVEESESEKTDRQNCAEFLSSPSGKCLLSED